MAEKYKLEHRTPILSISVSVAIAMHPVGEVPRQTDTITIGNMHDVVVYSRKDCHLCEIVKNTLTRVQSEADFHWREVDIDADPELQRKFTDEVPVVFVDGRKAFKYRMDARDFLRVLQGRE